MDFVVSVKLDTTMLDRIIANSQYTLEEIVTAEAFRLQQVAVPLAAYDTGALQNSIYVTTPKEDHFEEAAANAQGKNPEVGLVKVLQPTAGPNEYTARVGPSVDYGIYQEYGTYKMTARPYLNPAAEQVRQHFESGETWREIVNP